MEKNLWWVTRPTRDLRDLQEALKSFASIAEGKKWSKNRELHRRFEGENPAKTPNVGRHGGHGSGGRTWAAWLRMWGMWYNGDDVTLTDAGNLVRSAKNHRDVHSQIVHMIMNFQITSAYHDGLRPRQARDFCVFPFRFMLRLLLDKDVRFLTVDEIGLFLLNVKSPDEYGGVVSKISQWRDRDEKARRILRGSLIKKHAERYENIRADSPKTVEGHWRSVKDVANTLAINISYITELRYDRGKGTVSVRDEDAGKAEKLLAKYDGGQFSSLYRWSEAAFMRRFGTRHDRKKASGKETRPMTQSRKRYRRIAAAVNEMRRTGEMPSGAELVRRIQGLTDEPREDIERTITENPEIIRGDDGDAFAEYYLECAKDGGQHAEFEHLTRRIFHFMGFETDKRRVVKSGGGTPEIDGLILNEEILMSGLLECKGGSRYTFPIGDCKKMERTYIENFRTKRIGGKAYALDFFVYVIGSGTSGLDNFQEIVRNTGVRGSVIYARDLIRLYDLVRCGKITRVQMWDLFKCNGHLTWRIIDDLSKA